MNLFCNLKDFLSHNLINQNNIAAKKYVTSHNVTTIAHFKKKKDTASNEVKKAFNKDQDKKSGGDGEGGPDKDPNDDDPLPTHNHSMMMHIFQNKEGHLLDTPENRNLLRKLVLNIKNYLGKDLRHGREWYAKITNDGKQLWAWIKNGKIRDGGLNNIPKSWNSETGLCSPTIPNR